MDDPIELEDNFILIVSDQGVATPTAHAASHAAAGDDPLTLTLAQISNAGSIASQAANSVAITGGSIAGVTFSSSNVTLTGGTMSGVTITASSATLTGGTINGMVIGGVTPAAGTFTTLTTTGSVNLDGDLNVTGTVSLDVPISLLQGGTGATTQAGARSALGLGTMATANASLVTITGGTINGTVIGGVSPAVGTFSTLGATNLTVTGTIVFSSPLPITQGGTGAISDSAARTALGLAIGTNVQAYDADLSALAGLTSAADKVPYFTGSGTAAVADFTATGRSIVAAASVAAARTVLGISRGQATLASGTIAVADTSITANSVVVPVHLSTGTGTPGALSVALNAGVGFTINSDSVTDDNLVGYLVIY